MSPGHPHLTDTAQLARARVASSIRPEALEGWERKPPFRGEPFGSLRTGLSNQERVLLPHSTMAADDLPAFALPMSLFVIDRYFPDDYNPFN